MIGNYVQFNGKSVFLMLLVVLLMAVTTGPALANTAEADVEVSPALYQGGVRGEAMDIHLAMGRPCVCKRTGFLGREGGVLALLGVGQQAQVAPKAVGAAGDTYTLQPVHSQSGSWVVYTRTNVMGRDGGVLALLDQR